VAANPRVAGSRVLTIFGGPPSPSEVLRKVGLEEMGTLMPCNRGRKTRQSTWFECGGGYEGGRGELSWRQ
jgi:hypothetical protein